MTNSVSRITITFNQKMKNMMGDRYVPCEVSGRWLEFDESNSESKYIKVNVMTRDDNNVQRKLCELVLTKEDLINAVEILKNQE